MLKIFFLLFLFLNLTKAEDVYYVPEKWRDHISVYYFDVIFQGYDKKDEYLILVNNRDVDMKEFERAPFYEFRCIKPETVFQEDIFENNNYIGMIDGNCDCNKFEFYEYDYNWNMRQGKKTFKPKGSCFGYKDYSYQELKELGIEINII
jgi:hypothetical protein